MSRIYYLITKSVPKNIITAIKNEFKRGVSETPKTSLVISNFDTCYAISTINSAVFIGLTR